MPDDTIASPNVEGNEIKTLIRRRGGIRSRLTVLKNFLCKFQIEKASSLTSLEVRELSLRLTQLQELMSKFDTIQSEIEEIAPNMDEQVSERDCTEREFYSIISFTQELISIGSLDKKENCESVHSSCNNMSNSVKLPTINLPSFDGKYSKWLEYRDTFDSLINNNDSIPLINKFHYLRNSLVGSASVIVRSIDFTAANYQIAWKSLCDRFNNKNILINNHLQALVSINPIQKESFKALRYLMDQIQKNLYALNILEISTNGWDPLVIFLVSAKLDPRTKSKWEEHKGHLTHLPSLEEFVKFLDNRANVLETANSSRYYDNKDSNHGKENKSVKSLTTTLVGSQTKKCFICNKSHYVHQCHKFKALSLNEKLSEVAKHNLCTNCLRSGHNNSECPLNSSCRTCKEKHNSMLHNNSTIANVVTERTEATQPSTSLLPVSLSARSPGQVLLCTAQVEIMNTYNSNTYHARALLDTGSQSSFITKNLKERLGLQANQINSFNVSGINNVACKITEQCKFMLKSRISSFNITVNCLIIPKITGTLPSVQVNVEHLGLPNGVVLADPMFHEPAEIDILLGADHFFEIVNTNRIVLGVNKPVLQDSHLGWLVAGPIGEGYFSYNNNIHCNLVKNNKMVSLQDIHDSLQNFWEVEELPSGSNNYSIDEQYCESHFIKNTCRLPEGRFSVMLPLTEAPEQALGKSFPIAIKRFLSLENKLNKNPEVKKQYSDFIQEYSRLGHLSEIEKPKFGCYLPHHCVIREHHDTTKLRVVFDASAKTSSGKSLNDIQAVGPTVQSDLFSILIRFRIHKFILTADVEKMYRQVALDKSQRHLQLVLWRDYVDKPIRILQLNTLTYGMASAPFLATRCLVELADKCQDEVVSNIIKNDFYIDDLNTGASTEEELKHIYLNVTETLNSACFPLRKFRTNSRILGGISESSNCLNFHDEANVLGLKWSPKADELRFPSGIDFTTKVTKRIIISTTCKVFDPLGLVSCCIIKSKILLQQLWIAKLNWDDPVPEPYAKRWFNFIQNLHHLSDIVVPRYVLNNNLESQSAELHCFVDASQQAYGACVYMRSEDSKQNVTVRLLCAKTRVSPIKELTIPRLELCAALLGAQVSEKVLQAVPCNITKKYMWTDSTVVLGWLKTQSKVLPTFVRNRVNKINEITKEFEWKHVPTELNPADLASRGVDPQQLQSSSLWWEGPLFLKQNQWPTQPHITLKKLPEVKVLVSVDDTFKNSCPSIPFEKYSSYIRLKRVYAHVLRFINNCKSTQLKLKGPLQANELENSLIQLLKVSQSESFANDIKNLQNGLELHHKSKLLSLNPRLDTNGLIRVGGRLSQSDCQYDKKHPILLDAKHHLTKLLMKYEHLHLLHAGPQLLLSAVRERFWPVGGRILARTIIRQCVVCTRMKGQTAQPLMGDLPSVRVNPDFPFNSCGIDFAGPFMISSKKGRGNRITKAYLCVLVCLVTKALHLEVVSDLTTEAFISCLRRFVSRRGKPHTIYCDNGRNFVGANNELGRVIQSSVHAVSDYAANEAIKFKFIPAYSPHFGGIWEAGVKSAKFHLKRVAGNASLTFEELATLFTQIEAILNSRPLSPLSSDPTDTNPLTPGHFLIGRPLMSVPSLPVKTSRPNRYQLIEEIRQRFWERWRQEFMAELQGRAKWKKGCKPINVGDLIILKEDNLMPLHWRMGRVTKLYPGTDGICRVADIHTSTGTIKRAINKICPLPVADQN